MSIYDDYGFIKSSGDNGKKKKKKKENRTIYDEYKEVQEARARDLASQTARNLSGIGNQTDFMAKTEQMSNALNGYTDPLNRFIIDSALRGMNMGIHNSGEKTRTDIDNSYAKRSDRDRMYDRADKAIRANEANPKKILENRKASNRYMNQFEDKKSYDDAINMVRYGNKTYDELMKISTDNANRKAAGQKIDEDQDEWIRNYADSIKTAKDVDNERDRILGELRSLGNAFGSKSDITQIGNNKPGDFRQYAGNHTGSREYQDKRRKELNDRLYELNKEYGRIEERDFYRSIPGMADYEEVAARGMAREDNRSNESDKNIMSNWWEWLLPAEEHFDRASRVQFEPKQGDYMTTDEKKVYSYLLEKYGEKSADNYLDYLKDTTNYRAAEKDFKNIEGNVLLEELSAVQNGYGRFRDSLNNLGNLLTNDKAMPTSKTEYLSGMTREDLRNNGPKLFGSSLAQMVYDALENTSNIAPSIAVGSAAGPLAGALTTGITAGASSANAAWREGASKGNAVMYGLANGTLEAGLQYALGGISKLGGKTTDAARKFFDKKIKNTVGKAAVNMGMSAFGEGTEEYLQEIIDPVVRNLTLGENNEFKFVSDEALYSGLIGALTGGILDAPNGISKARTDVTVHNMEEAYAKIGSDLDIKDIDSLAEYASRTRELEEFAKEYRENPTDANAGRLKVETDNHIGDIANEIIRTGEVNPELENMDGYVAKIAKEALNEAHQIMSNSEQVLSKTLDTFSDSSNEALNTALKGAGVDETTFRNAFANYYSYGRSGMSFDTAEQNATYRTELTDAQKRLAYESGRNDRIKETEDAQANVSSKTNTAKGMLRYIQPSETNEHMAVPAKIKDLDERQRSSVMALRTFSEISGQDIVLYTSREVNGEVKAPNGWYDKNSNTIYIDVNSGDVGENAILRTASHEITHSIKEWSPDRYRTLQDYVIGKFEEDGSIDTLVREEIEIARRNGHTLTYDEAMDEVTANACEFMLKDTQSIARMANESPDIFKKVKNVIGQIITNIKKAFSGLRSGSLEHKRMSEILDDWTEIQGLWDDAFVEAGKKARKAQRGNVATEDISTDDRIFSLRDSDYSKYIDEDLVNFMDDVEQNRITKTNQSYVISTSIPQKLVDDIRNVIGVEVSTDYKNVIPKNSIEHIIKRHGKNGKADHSMSDNDNIGIIDYVVNNYDNIEEGRRESKEYRNSDGSYAKTIELSAKIDDNIHYVIEAVPEIKTSNKRLVVKSAYISKNKEVTQADNAISPVENVRNGVASTSDSKITQSDTDVNSEYSYRDHRSNREILADALMSATQTKQERDNLEAYQRRIERLDAMESLKREYSKKMDQAQTAGERDNYAAEISKLDKKIAMHDKFLLGMEAAEPLKALIRREAAAKSERNIKHIKEVQANRERRREMTQLRRSIKSNASNLITTLTKPTNQRHVPEALKEPVKNFLSSIDFISAYADPASFNTKFWQYRMSDVERVLADPVRNDIDIDFDPDLLEKMRDFINENKGKRLFDMDMKSLEDMYIIVRSLRSGISNANKMFANKRNENAEQLGTDTVREIGQKKNKKNHIKPFESMDEFFNSNMVDSAGYFHALGENAESIYHELYDGWLTRVGDIRKAGEYTAQIYKNMNITREDLKRWTGNNAERHTFRIGSVEFELTTAQIMSLYELGKRDQAKGHMFGVGICPDIIRGTTKNNKQVKEVKLTEGTLKMITDVLSEKEKIFADSLQGYMANECAAQGNETSMLLYGYKKFNEKNYFPIKVMENATNTKESEDRGVSPYAIINTGMTKNLTPKANRGLMARDIFDVFTDHVIDMANYHGLAAPITDAMKWYNYKVIDEDKFCSVKQEIERAFGSKYKSYFMKLMEDINGDNGREVKTPLMDMATRNYKAAAVAGNVRVVVQQPTAYIRAASMIDPKYLLKGMANPLKGSKEAIEHSNLAWWKSQGYYDTGLGRSMKEMITKQGSKKEKFIEGTLWPAGKADELTWGALWNAVKAEVADQTGLDVNSAEYMDAVRERFERIIDRTQVVDTIFAKSQIMRSKNGIHKAFTSFMAEPTKNYNMLRSAIADGNAKDITRNAAVYLTTSAANAALVAFIDSLRGLVDDDEKDKGLDERYVNNLIKDGLDNVNPINMLPYVKDVFNIITSANGYGASNRQEIAWAETLTKSVTEVEKYCSGNSTKTANEVCKLCCKTLSQLTGIPVYNIYRDIGEIPYNFFRYDINGENSQDEYIRQAADARLSGDMDTYREILEKLTEDGNEEAMIKKINSKTSKLKKEKDDLEKSESEDQTENEPDKEDSNDEDEDKAVSRYRTTDVTYVLDSGDISEANNILEDIYNTDLENADHTENGYKYETFKKTRQKARAELSKKYKKLENYSDRLAYGKKLKQLTIAKQFIYTDKDLSALEKQIVRENAKEKEGIKVPKDWEE